MTVRTRIAPSPTGTPHIGTAYVALFNKALARRHNGQFILRIEDSDQARSSKASESAIYRSLRWLGLDWDEGPEIGGEFGPYKTSERQDIYRSHLSELIDCGGAFYCFCTPDRLDALRQSQQKAGEMPGYDGHCLGLSEKEVQQRLERGDPYTIRLKVPREGECTFRDEIRGDVSIPWKQVDMQILRKSDGFPTYHLCATVDDHLMQISHILRGDEWLNSCPKHILIYEYLGWNYPKIFHLPLLRNPDQSKLSKRKNPTGIEYYRDRGYLPEALLNYLATMGWSMPDEREIFTFDDLVTEFDLSRITPRGPIFDPDKLDWMNGKYLRELSTRDFIERFNVWSTTDSKIERIVELVKPRVERFDQLYGKVAYLLGERIDVSLESFTSAKLDPTHCLETLYLVSKALDEIDDWTAENIQSVFNDFAKAREQKIREVLQPLFIAISGTPVALPLFDSMDILGPELTRYRVRTAIDALGGASKKKRKTLDKTWDGIRKSFADSGD